MEESRLNRDNRFPMTNNDIFRRLDRLARNLWWTWNSSAQRLFASVDPGLWEATDRNPIKLVGRLSPERRELIGNDEGFARRMRDCEIELDRYMNARTWFDREFSRSGARSGRRPLIAYFCAEYGVHESLPQYSGGLGVLAGDHLKSASDLGVPLVAIGLLYRCGYYTQEFNADGTTRVIYPQIDFSELPITDTGKIVRVPMGRGESVAARIWKQQVGRIQLYLLDTDIPQNKSSRQRALTRHLYGGDREYRIQQEILLGIGGMMALDSLGISPTVFHLNEGHAAFAALERLRRLRAKGIDLNEALAQVRDAGVFTTHTPVPAGNDRFSPALTMKYFAPMLEDLGLTRERFLALGREKADDKAEEFCMTVLALRLNRRCNGVAKLHGEVSREMWKRVFNVDRADQVPIGHVTNGVHSQTWLAPEMEEIYRKYLKPRWVGADTKIEWWKRAGAIPAEEFWGARQLLRRQLIEFVRRRLVQQLLRRGASQEELNEASRALDEQALTIGFARRFATYKRAPLVFHDPKRLARILRNARRPIQIIFAGKAHPRDAEGQAFAREIFKISRSDRFRGRVVLLEDYDLELGRVLTSGVDVWLNNPLRPQEASGTSGMKGPLQGGINCSIPDGWWPEGFNGSNGWMIGTGKQFNSPAEQDRRDAQAVYALLEGKIAPLFYQRDRDGIPRGWVEMMVQSMKSVCSAFSSHRMVGDYVRDYYMPAHRAGSS